MLLTMMITKAATIAGISANLLFSVCSVETKFKNTVHYEDGHFHSYGICQVQLPTAREQLSYVDALALMQPRVNLEVAALLLSKLENKYNNTNHAVAAFNAGHVYFRKQVNKQTYINQLYVNKVMIVYNSKKGIK